MQNVLKPINAVRDSVNVDETQHFQRGLEPKRAMNIGISPLENIRNIIQKKLRIKNIDDIDIDQEGNEVIVEKKIKKNWSLSVTIIPRDGDMLIKTEIIHYFSSGDWDSMDRESKIITLDQLSNTLEEMLENANYYYK